MERYISTGASNGFTGAGLKPQKHYGKLVFCDKIDKTKYNIIGYGGMNTKKHIKTKTQTSNHLFKLVLGGFFDKRGPNRATIQKVLYIISVMWVLSCIFPASAGAITDAFAGGVEDGLNSWIVGVCDSMFALGTDTNFTDVDPVSHGIFRTATYTYNPFENEGVKNIAEWSVIVWGVGILTYLLFGLLMVIISRRSNDISQGITYITKINTEHTLKQYARNSIIGILAAVFFYVFCGMVLLINYILTSMIMLSVLPSVTPSPDNIPIYVLTAGLYFVMLIFFAYRFLYINLFVGFGLLIVVMYVFSGPTRRIALFLTAGFFMVVFMQFVVVGITALGVLSIQASIQAGIIPGNVTMLFYCALLIILVIVGFAMTIGVWFLRKLIFAGATAVKVVI